MPKPKHIVGYIALYIVLRAVSFFFPPETSFHAQTLINSLLALAYLIATATLLIKRDERGWYLVAAELILGGAGNYFAIFGITLRTCLLIASIFIFKIQLFTGGKVKEFVQAHKNPLGIFALLLGWVLMSAVRGVLLGHSTSLVIADVIPYLFIAYYFPLTQLLKSEKFKNTVFELFVSAIFANALFILITLITYSSGLYILQNSYYHWFRDTAGGKITELPYHFYRLVLNEHLLLVPALIWLSWKRITEKNKMHLLLIITLLVILSLNLTRIYMLALAIGYLALFKKEYWRRWLTTGVIIAITFISSFTLLHLGASRGESLGWELFGLRLQSIVSPSLEPSSLSRMLLLPKIVEKIKQHPFVGSGLGDTVTVYSPVVDHVITTSQFDWGYFEIIDELGMLGFATWLLVLCYLGWKIIKQKMTWQLAGLIALLVINITSPALFHVLGIFWLAILYSTTLKEYV